jgi:hypothetical protein
MRELFQLRRADSNPSTSSIAVRYTIRERSAEALELPGTHFQALASPNQFDPFVIEQPANPGEQLGNLTNSRSGHIVEPVDDISRPVQV